jgi:succinate dehydrogenase subunit D
MAKTSEPFWWSLFGAGGVVAALAMPVTLLLTGFALPLGLVSDKALFNLIHHPLARLYLFGVISLPLFHGAHRTLHTLVDLGLRGMRSFLAILLYGTAILGTVVAAWLLIRL